MERRRLRLHGSAPLTPAELAAGGPADRVLLPGRCLSVTDTEQGNLATLWALDALEACAEEGPRVPVVFTAFDAVPELPSALSPRISAAARQVHLRAVSSAPEHYADALLGLPPELAQQPCWLMVGTPALLAFAAAASVLVTGDLAPERWPTPIRALRPEISLQVGTTRPRLARALVRALLTTP
ncbi:MAG: hypothetical protein QM778_07485 [Myxococcales bacterium]